MKLTSFAHADIMGKAFLKIGYEMSFPSKVLKLIYIDPFSENNWKLRVVSVLLMALWIFVYFFMGLSSAFYLISAGLIIGSFDLLSKIFDNKSLENIGNNLSVIRFSKIFFILFYFIFILFCLLEILKFLLCSYGSL